MNRLRWGVGLLGLALVTGCIGVTGSGEVVTQTREVGDFDRVAVSGGIDLVLTLDPAAEPRVDVVYDDNLQDRIVTEVEDGTLLVRSRGSYSGLGADRRVEVTTPVLLGLEASGGSDIDVTGADIGELQIAASGGSDVDLSAILVTALDVAISGGSSATVEATDTVAGAISGGSDLNLIGEPRSVDVAVSGGSEINR